MPYRFNNVSDDSPNQSRFLCISVSTNSQLEFPTLLPSPSSLPLPFHLLHPVLSFLVSFLNPGKGSGECCNLPQRVGRICGALRNTILSHVLSHRITVCRSAKEILTNLCARDVCGYKLSGDR